MNQTQLSTEAQLTQQAFAFVTHPSNSRVLYGVLKRLNVRQTDAYFEDALSEGRLIYVAVFKDYLLKFGQYDAATLRRYAYQRLYWRLLDWLRANTRRLSHQSELTDFVVSAYSTTESLITDTEHHDLFTRLNAFCTPHEKRLLSLLLDDQLTLTQVAATLNVSRPTLYKHRARLAAKLKRHFPEHF
ncbi:MAG TPA: hypothetical protein DCW31_05720 [Lactobacillus sp.]|nr:hypothetical protein [Lactobacillus sp.]